MTVDSTVVWHNVGSNLLTAIDIWHGIVGFTGEQKEALKT